MANNQYVNKVIYGDQTLIDLSSDTIAADKLVIGYTAHGADGSLITGTIPYGSPTPQFNNGRLEIPFPTGIYSGSINLETIQIPVPASGTNSITICVPNGTLTPNSSNEGDWIPITFTVDTEGNSEVTEEIIPASGVSF